MSIYFGKINEDFWKFTKPLGLSGTKSAKKFPNLSGGKSMKTPTLLAGNWKLCGTIGGNKVRRK